MYPLKNAYINNQGSENQNLTLVRMAIIKKLKIIAGKDVEKPEPLHCWQEHTLVKLLWKTLWRFLRKLENGIAI